MQFSQQPQRRRQVLEKVLGDYELLEVGHLADIVRQWIQLIVVDFERDDGAQIAHRVRQLVNLIRREIDDGYVAPATNLRRHRANNVERAVEVVQLVQPLNVLRNPANVVTVDPKFGQVCQLAHNLRLKYSINYYLSRSTKSATNLSLNWYRQAVDFALITGRFVTQFVNHCVFFSTRVLQ